MFTTNQIPEAPIKWQYSQVTKKTEMHDQSIPKIEWKTLAVAIAVYLTWGVAIFFLPNVSNALAILVVGFAVALHASLTHEAIHGHPFPKAQHLNAALVYPALGILYPYRRFRDTHLAHHMDCDLTDPYDDPESNFLDPAVWNDLPAPARFVLEFNNTLFGRLLIGPALGTVFFLVCDFRLAKKDPKVLAGWLWHIPSLVLVFAIVRISPMPIWAFVAAAYIGHSMIRIRTFLEHRSHEKSRGRTVVVEDSGILSLLFLNNNYHAVHHMHPKVPWYELPSVYEANKDRYLKANDGYVYHSYRDIFRKYLFRSKDPVAHPLYQQK